MGEQRQMSAVHTDSPTMMLLPHRWFIYTHTLPPSDFPVDVASWSSLTGAPKPPMHRSALVMPCLAEGQNTGVPLFLQIVCVCLQLIDLASERAILPRFFLCKTYFDHFPKTCAQRSRRECPELQADPNINPHCSDCSIALRLPVRISLPARVADLLHPECSKSIKSIRFQHKVPPY